MVDKPCDPPAVAASRFKNGLVLGKPLLEQVDKFMTIAFGDLRIKRIGEKVFFKRF